MTKVLNVLYRLMPSGAEMMLLESAESFKAAGVLGEIAIYDSELGSFSNQLRHLGYSLHLIAPHSMFVDFISFLKLFRAGKYDAVHIHVIKGFFTIGLAARLAGVPVIVKTFHGIFNPSGKLRWVKQYTCRKLASLIGIRFVAISSSVLDNEQKKFRTKCKLIWNWVNEDHFPLADRIVGCSVRESLGVHQDAFVLLSVGNCHSPVHQEIKNHQLILRALALLPNHIKNNIVYIHVGKESPNCPEQKLASELGVSKHVIFLGSRTDIPDLLSAANVFVMSSLHEGLGLSAVEAALSGRDLLLTDVLGLKDFGSVIDGVYYADLTPKSMAQVITALFHNRGVEQGDASKREMALRIFSMRTAVEKLTRLYRNRE